MDVFAVCTNGKYLIYAPLHRILILVNKQAAKEIRHALISNLPNQSTFFPYIEILHLPGEAPADSRHGLLNPVFLGIIPTRGCNMNCQYCDFASPKQDSPVMDFSMARQAINAFLILQKSAGRKEAEIHFFGGEPFFAGSVVHFSVEYARLRAGELGLDVRFEVTTNGLYNSRNGRWIAENFDSVVLSLDGPKDIQDRQRPAMGGKSAFATVINNARLFSLSTTELILRACITNETVTRMDEIARWFCQEFQPSTVCFETLTPSIQSQIAGLKAPDPYEFARNFYHAVQILNKHGIASVFATAETDVCRTSFCPVGKDALIVSPDGTIDGCYLLHENWEKRGLNLCLGQIRDGDIVVSAEALRNVRNLNVENRPLCVDCFCRYHCAGGCHVNHDTNGPAGQFDSRCIQTRIITITNLLKRLGQDQLAEIWLSDRSAVEASIWQNTDRICSEAWSP
jgi:uncharacterized protein